jgi:hypothetical protein
MLRYYGPIRSVSPTPLPSSTVEVSPGGIVPKLRHIILVPHGGLTSRMRAIASARRLAKLFAIRCTVQWNWGNYYTLFKQDALVDWRPDLPKSLKSEYTVQATPTRRNGGSPSKQRIWISKDERIILKSSHVFNAYEERTPITFSALREYLPHPTESICAEVQDFSHTYLRETVGMHIRRSDQLLATERSPDHLYVQEAKRIIDEGRNIFLASDTPGVIQKMIARFGKRILLYPKQNMSSVRWPRREFCFRSTMDDLIELHLLAACEYVVGSPSSSYSVVAAIINGSPHCKLLSVRRALSNSDQNLWRMMC